MQFLSSLAVPLMITAVVIFGIVRKTDVYSSFTAGAKLGLENVFGIIPSLMGLMTAIYMFRASGALDILLKLLKPATDFLKIPPAVMPLALLRPISGSGSLALVNDIFSNCGPDSVEGKIASVMMGSTETTFYTIAVYFGAIGAKRLRHTVKASLIADLAGILLAIFLTRFFLP